MSIFPMNWRNMEEMKNAVQDVNHTLAELAKNVPDEMQGFEQFMGAVLKPGKLDLKTEVVQR